MSFEDVRLTYALACVVLGLIILSPTLAMVVRFPDGERFSEFWVVGQDRSAGQYPFNVSANSVYSVYLGVGNHMGDFEYYKIHVKLRNQTEP